MSTKNQTTVFACGGKNYFTAATTENLIEVTQHTKGARLFTVTYGLQVKAHLTYAQACSEIGAAILHNACCENLASNEGK